MARAARLTCDDRLPAIIHMTHCAILDVGWENDTRVISKDAGFGIGVQRIFQFFTHVYAMRAIDDGIRYARCAIRQRISGVAIVVVAGLAGAHRDRVD